MTDYPQKTMADYLSEARASGFDVDQYPSEIAVRLDKGVVCDPRHISPNALRYLSVYHLKKRERLAWWMLLTGAFLGFINIAHLIHVAH